MYWDAIGTTLVIMSFLHQSISTVCSIKIIVWALICAHCKTSLVPGRRHFNAQDYIKILEKHLQSCVDDKLQVKWVFQQNNTTTHITKTTFDRFCKSIVQFMKWLVQSPNLSAIKNLWEVLSRAVYAENCQISTIQSVMKFVSACWDHIDSFLIEFLLRYMYLWFLDVIARRASYWLLICFSDNLSNQNYKTFCCLMARNGVKGLDFSVLKVLI